ncbi:tetratricopeptide repeat protein [Psychrobacter sp. H8-1]|uniref:tetratricopeptide repeat protein n=1 Tax=Psychrobacter sp. H8-1 TaxID=2774129 RepID=UPI001917C59C|nr:tetratricopeptide repeat protein [Psychrobacter sp. H8-1]
MAEIVIFVLATAALILSIGILWYFIKTIRIIWRYNSLLAVAAVIFGPMIQIVFYLMPKDEFDRHEASLFKKYFLLIGLVALLGIIAAIVIPATQAQNSVESISDEELIELATKGDVKAQSRLGTMYVKGDEVLQDYDKAVYWYEKAAEQGDAAAQIGLGMSYYSGEGVPQNSTKAAEFFESAAEQGLADAQHNIAIMYSNGVGVRQNYNTAFKWYEKAANQGVGESMLSLAWMYHKGEGVRQDNVQAKEWYGKACDKGNQMGCDNYRSLN